MAERPHDLAQPSERPQSTAEVLVAVVEKNRTQEVRVYLSAWKGCNLIDVRTYVEPCDMDGERRPTRRGVTLALGRLPELIDGLVAAEREARRMGLIREGGS
jgi:hypothetical protein